MNNIFSRYLDVHESLLFYFLSAADEVITCEGSTMTLTCNTEIHVDSAMYGHYDHDYCGGPLSNDNCHKQGDYDVVDGLCSGQQTCSVEAVSSTFGGDPCPGTVKYLQVQYTCLASQYHYNPYNTEIFFCDG